MVSRHINESAIRISIQQGLTGGELDRTSSSFSRRVRVMVGH